MPNKNSITGDSIVTKPSKTYADNFDSIFRKPKRIHTDEEIANWKYANEEVKGLEWDNESD